MSLYYVEFIGPGGLLESAGVDTEEEIRDTVKRMSELVGPGDTIVIREGE